MRQLSFCTSFDLATELPERGLRAAKTGQLLWYKQFVPHDVHDYDLTHTQPVIKSKSRTLIVTTGKDGLMRVVDSHTHEIVYSKSFTTCSTPMLRLRPPLLERA